MPHPDLIIRGRRVVLPDVIASATVHISDGRIIALGSYDDLSPDCELIEAGEESIVMPGLVDTHVHVNEPGRTEWEGFASATRAAAAGGVTTVIDMPLNSIPPTTTIGGLEEKIAASRDKCYVDVGFWGGVVPGNTPELERLARSGVVGFKCFLIHSGVDEFPNVTEKDLREAMSELKRLEAILIVHAEAPGPIERMSTRTRHEPATGKSIGATEYQTFLNSRPRAAENEAVELMIKLSGEFGTRVHIVHHSSADALPMLRQAIAEGLPITVETCPHYLFFAAEDIGNGATEFKCCPPIRERENREQLWEALRDGTIQMVVSDHSPCLPGMKLPETGDFLEAWGGIASLQFRLPVVWTEARKRGHSIEDLASWLCASPAKLVNLDERKGRIAVGWDADVTIWNPDREFVVEPGMIHHRHKLTPYAGEKLLGTVEKTFLRGRKIYDDGEFTSEPEGRMLV
ncbi:MAG: allantoinase AllB [Pyrinomonadaceae bacterium]